MACWFDVFFITLLLITMAIIAFVVQNVLEEVYLYKRMWPIGVIVVTVSWLGSVAWELSGFTFCRDAAVQCTKKPFDAKGTGTNREKTK